MAAKSSTMLALGSHLPEFCLPNVSEPKQIVSNLDFIDKPLLVMFICNHCPFVIHLVEPMTELANRYQAQGVGVIAISSNDAQSYPQDGPEPMRAFGQQAGFEFPYLYDETQDVAKAFTAACTPDFFLYNARQQLVYRGQMDSSRPGNQLAVSGEDLAKALQAVLLDSPNLEKQLPSIGCSIKWRAGNQPEYF